MDNRKKYQILDGTTLKLIAMISMVFDHAGDMFFPDVMWPRMIGRLAMPIFSFFIAEGFSHTRDKKKYLCRLGIFALISEIPFDLAFEGKIGFSHQNIMLSFFLAVVALMLYDWIQGGTKSEENHASIGKTVLGVIAVAAIAALSLLLRADPNWCGCSLSRAHENSGILLHDRTQLYPSCHVYREEREGAEVAFLWILSGASSPAGRNQTYHAFLIRSVFQQPDYIQISRTSTTDIREMTVKSQFVISHSLYVSN